MVYKIIMDMITILENQRYNLVGLEEVEDVVGPLVGGLVGHAGLLQEVRLDVAARHPPHGVKPHADELALIVAYYVNCIVN